MLRPTRSAPASAPTARSVMMMVTVSATLPASRWTAMASLTPALLPAPMVATRGLQQLDIAVESLLFSLAFQCHVSI